MYISYRHFNYLPEDVFWLRASKHFEMLLIPNVEKKNTIEYVTFSGFVLTGLRKVGKQSFDTTVYVFECKNANCLQSRC